MMGEFVDAVDEFLESGSGGVCLRLKWCAVLVFNTVQFRLQR